MPYAINTNDRERRKIVEESIACLDKVSDAVREKIVTAWVTTWASGEYEDFRSIPWDPSIDGYTLVEHVNEVTRIGLALAERAKTLWGVELDVEILTSILILHDVDKPMMFVSRNGVTERSKLYHEIPHGVVGAMLLKELGFPTIVVSSVGTHSPRMPFPGKNYEAFILHYADHFCCDNALLRAGKQPLYFHLKLPD